MFALPRSSWQDYDKTKLSEGGVIVSRSQKSVTLPAAAAAAIGLGKTTASPVEIMNAILKAPVDLLWFGGIGTYLRASTETNQDVGDRANDAIRVTALDVRAKVIGEGANLGVTQRARIEFGLNGGRCNSDAIDNSGGVNCSDVEVNIKIALASAMRKGSLTRPARNKLLAEMTDEVGGLVLSNNYEQTLALSIARKRGLADIAHQSRFMAALEARGLLDRAVETLPSPAALAEREARGEPLTRAELGVLLAYAKIVLFSDIVASDVPDDPHFDRDLMGYFPDRMAKKYAAEIHGHRLRREIIARVVANDLVNRGGPSFVNRLQEATGRSAADVVRTFAVVRDGFALAGALSRDRRARQPDRRSGAARPLPDGQPADLHGQRLVSEERCRHRTARPAHRRTAGGAQGARAENRFAAAGLLARADRGAAAWPVQGRRAGKTGRTAGAGRCGGTHPRHRADGADGECRHRRRGEGVFRGQRRLPHSARRGCGALDHAVGLLRSSWRCRARPTRSALPGAASRWRRSPAMPRRRTRWRHGWRPAAKGSRASANGCRR